MKECANCDFHIEGACACPSYEKWYACPIENKKPENIQALKEYGEPRTIEQVLIRAEVVGILPSGQKRVHLLADGADGIEFVTNENSLVKAGRLTTEPQITECEHCLAYDPFKNGVDGFCRKMGKVMCVSDFCSYAERREDG